jgi:hypothetical protein
MGSIFAGTARFRVSKLARCGAVALWRRDA